MKKATLLFAIILALCSITEARAAFSIGDSFVVYNPDDNDNELLFGLITNNSELRTVAKLQNQGYDVYPLNTGDNNPRWLKHKADVKKVKFHESFRNAKPTTTFHWFFGMNNLQTIENLTYLDTSLVTDMTGMFFQCTGLTRLDLSTFDTSKVKSMSYMFYGMSNMMRVNVSTFDTGEVTDMSGMFFDCKSLTALNVSNFNTSNVKRMDYMFDNCRQVTSLDLGNFDTSNVTNMNYMFRYCESLTDLKLYTAELFLGEYIEYLSTFKTANVTTMENMFDGCESLTDLVLPDPFTIASGASTQDMFLGCNGLEKLYLANDMSALNSEAFKGIGSAAQPCRLTSPSYDPEATEYTATYMVWKKGYFVDALRSPLVYYSDGKLSFEYGIPMLDGHYNLPSADSRPGWLEHANDITTVTFDSKFQKVFPTSTAYWFNLLKNLTTIEGIEYLNTSEVIDMRNMFQECTSLTTLDVSHFNTEKAIDMRGMFGYCLKLDSLDLSSFVFSTQAYTNFFLEGCTGLKQLQVPLSASNLFSQSCLYIGNLQVNSTPCILITPDGFDFEGVNTNGSYFMWKGGKFSKGLPFAVYNDKKLTFYYGNKYRFDAGSGSTLYDISSNYSDSELPGWLTYYGAIIETVVFDPSFYQARPVTTANWFRSMGSLTSVQGIGNLNTSETVKMNHMFYGCTSLAVLDLHYFDTSAANDLSHMLDNCNKLRFLDLSSFVINEDADVSYMLYRTRGLKQLNVSASIVECANDSRSTMFYYVGSSSYPCHLALPANVTLDSDEVSTFTDFYRWRLGFFVDYHEPYAVYDQNKLTFYCDGNLSQWEAQGVTVMNLPNNDWAIPTWYSEYTIRASIEKVVFDQSFSNAFPTSTFFWFASMNQVSFSGWKYFNTDRLHTAQYMFYLSDITSLDLSEFKTSQTVLFDGMFNNCSKLEQLILPTTLVTSRATAISYMFHNCSSIKRLDLSNFQLAENITTTGLLSDCEALQELTISESMVDLYDDACSGVGTETNPCLLNVPEGVTLDTTEGPGYFIWKEGYFMSPSDILIGDANGDKSVSVADVTLVVAYVKNGPQDDFHFRNADANGDGEISVGDVTEIVNIIVGNQ